MFISNPTEVAIRESFSKILEQLQAEVTRLCDIRPESSHVVFQELRRFIAEAEGLLLVDGSIESLSNGSDQPHTTVNAAQSPLAIPPSTDASTTENSFQERNDPSVPQSTPSNDASASKDEHVGGEPGNLELRTQSLFSSTESHRHDSVPVVIAQGIIPSESVPEQPELHNEDVASNTLLPRPSNDDPGSIKYEIQDGVFLFIPTTEQWEDFPGLLQEARRRGADKVGICKVQLPEDSRFELTSTNPDLEDQKPRLYHPRRQANGTFKMEVEEDVVPPQVDLPVDNQSTSSISVDAHIQRYEEMLESADSLKDAFYYIDMDAGSLEERARLGLPEKSPIWPLEGDRLRYTKKRIPGMHWPYAYRSKAFGASFTCHKEDYETISINYLYDGEKIWCDNPPDEAGNLEEQLKVTNPSYYKKPCSQFLRHAPTTIPRGVHEQWGIKYHIVRQLAGEAIITFPHTYHQGFTLGPTTAEAVNYGDEHWNYDGYRDCISNICPAGFMTRDMLSLRAEDEEQLDLSDEAENDSGSELSDAEGADGTNDEGTSHKSSHPTRRKKLNSRSNDADFQSRGRKRKSSAQELGANKKGMRDGPQSASSKVSLKQLEQIPQEVALPETIFNALLERTQSEDHQAVFFLTRLFFAVAAPDAFADLKDACCAVSTSEELTIPRGSQDIDLTVKALDRLDSTDFFNTVLRRHLSALLVERRIELMEKFQKQRPQRTTRRSDEQSNCDMLQRYEGVGRTSSMALSQLMMEAYPMLKKPPKSRESSSEYGKRYSSLKNRLNRGRHWHMLKQRFSVGILALVPTGGEHGFTNYEIETVPVQMFVTFLDVLDEYRGKFLHQISRLVSDRIEDMFQRRDSIRRCVFENMDTETLKKERLDSPDFVGFCEVDSSD